jgi:ribosomal protein S18 acetylase RimI-like enzyme
MSATVRHAEAQDREAAGAVCRRVLAEDPPYPYELNIGMPECLNLVAEEKGTIVGYASVVLKRWDSHGRAVWQRVAPYLAFIGVVPEKQRRGTGELLLRATISAAAARCPDEPRLFLEHHRQNATAKRLFERVGFRHMSRDEVFRETGVRPVNEVMCFELGSLRAAAGIG